MPLADVSNLRETAVVLVHDVVNSFVDPAKENYDTQIPAMLHNIAALLDAARDSGAPVIFAAPGPGENIGPRNGAKVLWGSAACEPPGALGPRRGDIVIRKPRYGAFHGSTLARTLRDLNRDCLIVCGLSLAGGVETTIRDAHNHDLRSILALDSCLCRPIPEQGWGFVTREDVEKVTLSILAERFARIASTSEICSALRGASA